MIKWVVIIVALLLSGMPAGAEEKRPSAWPGLHLGNRTASGAAMYTGSLFGMPMGDVGILEGYLQRSAAGSAQSSLSLQAGRLYGFERFELSTLDCAIYGAGAATTMGMFLGAVGTTLGLFDEQTAWAIIGASALAGATYGVTVNANDSDYRIRYRWDPDR
ncbi:MAG: hypothetical protein O7D32_10680 [bacterium]|nr:hypothetical protein [bacterium]